MTEPSSKTKPAAPHNSEPSPSDQATCLEFDLSMIPAQDRFALWREHGSTIYRPLADGPTATAQLTVRSRIWPLGNASLMVMEASSQHYERTPTMVRKDGADHYGLVLLEKGMVIHRGLEQELTAKAGDLLLLDMAQVAQSQWSRHAQLFAIFPRDTLSPAHGRPVIAGRLAANQPQARLLAGHMRSVLDELEQAPPIQRESLALGLASLVRSYFCQHNQVEALTPPEEASEVLALSIRRWIDSQLHRRDLNAASVAGHFHLSRSGLYRLFESAGGVQHYIQEQRLTAALLQLRASMRPDQQLGTLAFSLGFSSASAFSHAFRRRWGITPRECQKQAAAVATERAAATIENRLASDGAAPGPKEQQLIQTCQHYYQGMKGKGRSLGPNGR